MEREKKVIYTPHVENSMLELLDDDLLDDAPPVPPVYSTEFAIESLKKMDYPKRDFWKVAK